MALLAGLFLLASIGCAPPSATPQIQKVAPGPPAFPLTFSSSISYAAVLEAITDAGLQPAVYCGTMADKDAGRVITTMKWQPAGQRPVFQQEHRLFVTFTPLQAPNAVINALPGLQQRVLDEPITCPDGSMYFSASAMPLTTGDPVVMTAPQVLRAPYTQVTFAPATDYATALYAISNLGLRLADPCYEQGVVQLPAPGQSRVWHPMGQETTFSATHSLVVATAPLITPTTWSDQLRALTGVAQVTIPYTAVCRTGVTGAFGAAG